MTTDSLDDSTRTRTLTREDGGPVRSAVEDATRAFQHHRVEWFPPEPPYSRKPTYLCLGCGWRTELDGFADESNAGLEHRIEAALTEVGLSQDTEEEDIR